MAPFLCSETRDVHGACKVFFWLFPKIRGLLLKGRHDFGAFLIDSKEAVDTRVVHPGGPVSGCHEGIGS